MANEAYQQQNDNPNHVRESGRFCEYLSGSFAVKYSKFGIIHFKCPMYVKENPEIACLETRLPNCPVRDRLVKMVRKLK